MILNSKIIGNQKKVLIILHGLFGSLDNWYSIAKEFALNYQVHILDQRNHGRSFHDISHNYMDMTGDLLKYIKHHNLLKPNLLGHSMGGKTAMYFALSHSAIINKLIVVDIAPKKYNNSHLNLINLLLNINQSVINSRKQVSSFLKHHFIDDQIIQFLLKSLYWVSNTELKFRFNIDSISRSIDDLMDFEFSGSSWGGDSYFLKAENSDYILDSDSELIRHFFSNFKLINFHDSGHWVHFDQKTFFLNTINNILK